jgi:hypothetical protein
MKLPWVREREKNEVLDEVEAELEEGDALFEEQTPRVNSLIGWLEARKLVNGFGDDFEWSLANPRR